MSMLNFLIGWHKHDANRRGMGVTLLNDEAGRRCVEVAMALSLPRRFEYVGARQYQRRLWGEETLKKLHRVISLRLGD